MNLRTVFGAGFYAGVGLAALARPELVPQVFGGAAPTATSRTEIRAVYGGLPLAMAALITAEAGRSRRPMTAAMAVLSGGMAAGRLVGVAVERESDGPTTLFGALEVATALALGSLARRPT